MALLASLIIVYSKRLMSLHIELKEHIIVQLLLTLTPFIHMHKVCFSKNVGPAILGEYFCVIDSLGEILSPLFCKFCIIFRKIETCRNELTIYESNIVYHIVSNYRLI